MHNSAIAICCFCFLGFLGAVLPSVLAPSSSEPVPVIVTNFETTTTTEEITTTTEEVTTTEIIEELLEVPELSEALEPAESVEEVTEIEITEN